MTVHRPGRPEDLPDPNLLWTRWAALATATSDTDEDYDWYLPFRWYLHFANWGSTWMGMARYDDGRFVLFGEDEASYTKWHKTPIDVLAEAPTWLPLDKLRDLVRDAMIGFVYWYEDSTWHRAPYPETLADDGLDCSMASLSLTTAEEAASVLTSWCEDCDRASDARLDFMAQAEHGAVTDDVLNELAEHAKMDVAELKSLARRFDLIAGAPATYRGHGDR
jgi:hypothetical protein